MQESRRPDLLDRLGDQVSTRSSKLALVLLIILSVLPFPAVEEQLRPLFLLAFGAELAIRAALILTGRARRSTAEWLFVLIDLAAFLSFLPLERWLAIHEMHYLALMRLARLLVLVRFSRELARDIYLIMTRREQLQQFALVTLAVFMLSFISAVMLAQLGVPHNYDGNGGSIQDFWDRLWWSFRSLESADNLVQNLHVHPLIGVISLLLTITGVFIVSFIIGIGTNVVDQVVRAERRRPVGYRGHSLVVGPVQDSEILVREFVRIYDKHRPLRRLRLRDIWAWAAKKGPPPRRHALPRMALLGPGDDPPVYLYDAMMRWVVYRQGDGSDPEALARVNAQSAKRVIMLARPDAGHDADAVTIAALAALRAVNPIAQAFVEVLESQNRDIVHAVGGPGTFPLDAPRFLGLFLCQHLLVPGVETLYRDLLTAGGSEFYTHIFVDQEETVALQRFGKDGHLSFEEMVRCAYLEHRVLLIGVFLGEQHMRRSPGDLVPSDGLVRWVNPTVLPDLDPRVEALGGRPGQIPVGTLRGLLGVSATYVPLQGYARALASGNGMRPARWAPSATRKGAPTGSRAHPREIAHLLKPMRIDDGQLRRLLIVGYSTALPSLMTELARFIPGIEVVLVMGSRGDETAPIAHRLDALELGLNPEHPLPGEEGRWVELERGGHATVYTHEGADLAGFAASCLLRIGAVDAAVFLSEPDGNDRDARTSLRLLRFARALESQATLRSEKLHLIAEFVSVWKGERLRSHLDARKCGFHSESQVRLTLVSTEQIKNYFMVHTAFVPGVTDLYDELLSEQGQEIVRLDLPALREVHQGDNLPAQVCMMDLVEALLPRHCLPIAVELIDGRVLLNPNALQPYPAGSVVGLYAIADSLYLEGRTAAARFAARKGVVKG